MDRPRERSTSGQFHPRESVVLHQFAERAHGRNVNVAVRFMPGITRRHPDQNLSGDLHVARLIAEQHQHPVVPARQVGKRDQHVPARNEYSIDLAQQTIEGGDLVHDAEGHDHVEVLVRVRKCSFPGLDQHSLDTLRASLVEHLRVDVQPMYLDGSDAFSDELRQAAETATDVEEPPGREVAQWLDGLEQAHQVMCGAGTDPVVVREPSFDVPGRHHRPPALSEPSATCVRDPTGPIEHDHSDADRHRDEGAELSRRPVTGRDDHAHERRKSSHGASLHPPFPSPIISSRGKGRPRSRLRAPTMAQYAALPSLGLVDTLPMGTTVDLVGYVVQNFVNGGGPCGGPCKKQPGDATTRFFASTRLIAGNDSISDEFIKLHSYKGGTCFGDSGGPNLLGGTNIVFAVNSFVANSICSGHTYSYRVDTAETLAWITAAHRSVSGPRTAESMVVRRSTSRTPWPPRRAGARAVTRWRPGRPRSSRSCPYPSIAGS